MEDFLFFIYVQLSVIAVELNYFLFFLKNLLTYLLIAWYIGFPPLKEGVFKKHFIKKC